MQTHRIRDEVPYLIQTHDPSSSWLSLLTCECSLQGEQKEKE